MALSLFYFLKNIGVMDKIVEALVSLVPVFIGLIVCWISMPLANKLRKMGIDQKLVELGIEEGDIVRILDYEFEFK